MSIEYLTNIKNHRLFKATKEFVVFATNVLVEHYERDIIKIKEERPTDSKDAFLYDLQNYRKFPFSIDYLTKNKDRLLQSPEFKKCQEIMSAR